MRVSPHPALVPLFKKSLSPPHISSPLCPQSSVAQCRGACSLLLCSPNLCCVPFTLKPNDGVRSGEFGISLPLKASSIRNRAALEPMPCSVPVISGALRGALQHSLGQGTEILYSGGQSQGSGGFPSALPLPARVQWPPPLGPPRSRRGEGLD